jgi:hypothetical protein
MLVNSYQSTQHYNPEDSHLLSHCCENLKSALKLLASLTKWMGVGTISCGIDLTKKAKRMQLIVG